MLLMKNKLLVVLKVFLYLTYKVIFVMEIKSGDNLQLQHVHIIII